MSTTKMQPEKSPAFTLIEHVYERQGHRMGRSRERFHDGVRSATRLAISFGLAFNLDDVANLAEQQHASYHNTSIYQADEYDYAIACGKERGRFNPTFCLSYEKWKDRKPFIVKDVDAETGTRVYVGRDFVWYGERVTCTSFAEDGSHFVACSYKSEQCSDALAVGSITYFGSKYRRIASISDNGLSITFDPADIADAQERKVDRRHKITHADIKDFHAAAGLLAEIEASFNTISAADMKSIKSRYELAHGQAKPSTLRLAQLKELRSWVSEHAEAAAA